MSTASLAMDHARTSRTVWVGRIVSALPVLSLVMSGVMKLSHHPKVVEGFVLKFGYREDSLLAIGLLELACTLVYVVPRTKVLGAVLLTAYLGGAVATHVRVGDVFITPVVLGVLVWVGLYLRDPRIRSLASFQSPVSDATQGVAKEARDAQ